MAGTRATRSASKSSPAPGSTKSTPRTRRQASSSLKSTPEKPARNSSSKAGLGKTSPYFSKTKAPAKSSPLAGGSRSKAASKLSKGTANGKGKSTKEEGDDKVSLDSATGMTETEEESSSEDEATSEDEFAPTDDEGDAEIEDEELDSDALDDASPEIDDSDDEDFGGGGTGRNKGKKRKSIGNGKAKVAEKIRSNGVKRSKIIPQEEGEEEDYGDIELEEGQEIAMRIYPAPKTGQVPSGRISHNTMNFLANLQIPERNDRDWFKAHEPSFRQAEQEWKDFVAQVQMKFHEADDEVPILPPRDVIHRIYRDVRFSSDKTPYKKSFSLSTSRGGRKGIWAGYHLSISPNNNSILASGVWQPGKNELSSIRTAILLDPTRFREVIGSPEFVGLFGEAKEHPKGKRRNVFGHDDALKNAPKGVDKGHKDIDLLKLRSVAVVHHFTDEEVISKDFQDKVQDVIAVMAPFVHMLNDTIALPQDGDDDGDDANAGDDGEDGGEEDD